MNDEIVPETLSDAFDMMDFQFFLNLPDEEIHVPERLFFQIEQAHWYYEDFLADKHKHLAHFHKFDEFALEVFKRCETLAPLRARFDEMYDAFRQYRSKIPVYGAILLNRDLTKVLLVRGFRGKSWSFPKGKVNQDEDEVVCAAREVFEETGFNCYDMINPRDSLQTVTQQGKLIKLFIVSGMPEDFKYEPTVRKEIGDIAFFDIRELPTNNKTASNKFWALQAFIPRLIRWIQRQKSSGRGSQARSRPKSRAKEAPSPAPQQQQQQQQQQERQSSSRKSRPLRSRDPESFPAAAARPESSSGFRLDLSQVLAAMSPHLH